MQVRNRIAGVAFPSRAVVGDAVWNAFVHDHPSGWFFHTTMWLDYCLAYQPGAVDHSFGILENGRLIGVVPLIREGDAYTMGGEPGMAPLFAWSMSPKAWTECWGLITEQARMWRLERVAFRGHPSAPIFLPSTWRDIGWDTYVVDLTRPKAERWAAVRKSYHSLVNRANADGLFVSASPFAVVKAHEVHRAVSGRETRPVATWEAMAEWARHGFLVVAHTTEWTAMALAIVWKRHAYYASGAALEPNLSHGLQWALIEGLATAPVPVETYEVGWAAKPGDSEKAQGIARFKAGWGGQLVPIAAGEWRQI